MENRECDRVARVGMVFRRVKMSEKWVRRTNSILNLCVARVASHSVSGLGQWISASTSTRTDGNGVGC